MVAREKFPFQTDRLIEFVSPADLVTKNALDNANDSATCSFKVYDPAKDETLSAVEAIGQTTLSVNNAGVFVVGDSIELIQDDDTIHASTIDAVDPAAGTVNIADATTVAAAVGNRFRVIFGSSVTMVEFGTAKFGRTDPPYGFRATLVDTHPVHILDQEFDVEVRFVGAPAGGLDKLDVICGVIKPDKECN